MSSYFSETKASFITKFSFFLSFINELLYHSVPDSIQHLLSVLIVIFMAYLRILIPNRSNLFTRLTFSLALDSIND